MFSSIKYIAIAVIVLAIIGSLWYITNLKADLAVSEENSKKLMAAVETQKELLAMQQEDLKKIQNINKELNTSLIKQQEESKALMKRFNESASGNTRDFGALSAAKPGLIQPKVNNGSKNVARCFELLSGAPMTEAEKNAKTSKEINPECPSLFPGYSPVIK